MKQSRLNTSRLFAPLGTNWIVLAYNTAWIVSIGIDRVPAVVQLIDNAMDVLSVEHEEGRGVLRFMRSDVSEVDDSDFVHERYNISPCLVPRFVR